MSKGISEEDLEYVGWNVPEGFVESNKGRRKDMLGEEDMLNPESAVEEPAEAETDIQESEVNEAETNSQDAEEPEENISEEPEEDDTLEDNIIKLPLEVVIDKEPFLIYEKERVVNLVQMGVDYSNKMRALKGFQEWVVAISNTPLLKILVEKVANGEDVTPFINLNGGVQNSQEVMEPAPTRVEEVAPVNLDDIDLALFNEDGEFDKAAFKQSIGVLVNSVISSRLKSNVEPAIVTLAKAVQSLRTQFQQFAYDRLKEQDEYFEPTMQRITQMLKTPGLMDEKFKQLLQSSSQTFGQFFVSVRNQIIDETLKNKAPEPEVKNQVQEAQVESKEKEVPAPTVKEVLKKAKKGPAPVLESSRDSRDDVEKKVLKDFFALSDSEFDAKLKEVEGKYKR